MIKTPWLSKIMIPAAMMIGLVIGLGVSRLQINRDQQAFQDRIKEANRKIAFIQKKMAEEKNDATVSIEQRFQGDMDKLQNEKKAFAEKLGKLKEQIQKLEATARESDEASIKAKKELQETERNNKALGLELKKTAREKQVLQAELKKMMGEKQAIQAELKKTAQGLGRCESNNAELCVIAGELVKKYRNKGLGSILIEKEPLTQIKKIELEQFVHEYEDKIEEQKIKKNNAGEK